jgi:hypothetical protein
MQTHFTFITRMANYINVEKLLHSHCNIDYQILHDLLVAGTQCFIDCDSAYYKAKIIPFNTRYEVYEFNPLTSDFESAGMSVIRWDWLQSKLQTYTYYDKCTEYTEFKRVWVDKNSFNLPE